LATDIESFLFEIILIFIFVVLSALFSGSETAFFSLSRVKLQHLKENGGVSALRVVQLLEKPRQLLITILIGNTLVNVATATLAALLTTKLSHLVQLDEAVVILLEIIVVTGMLLLLGEITPKIIAIKNAVAFSQRISLFISIIHFLFYPITIIITHFTSFLSDLLGLEEIGAFFSQEELKTLIEVSEEKGAIEEDEKEMIHSIFLFAQTYVREIMVPRIDMVCVEKNTSLDGLIELIKQNGFTRIPLYQGRVDNILGIIHAKDLLPYIHCMHHDPPEVPVDLTTFARPVQFVPENKKIDDLLREFQRDKIHMAIVVDEYGGTAGLITLEDILEEIVGEIQDEYDTEGPLIKKIDEKTYLAQGKINVYELQEILNIQFPISEGFDTLAGLIFDHTGYVPKENEKIQYEDLELVIEKIDRNRIVLVKILMPERHETEENSQAARS